MDNEILFSLIKEGNPTISDSIDETREHYTKWNKLDPGGQVIHLHDLFLKSQTLKTEHKMMFDTQVGRKNWKTFSQWVESFHYKRWVCSAIQNSTYIWKYSIMYLKICQC
jgi:hypothetical protein